MEHYDSSKAISQEVDAVIHHIKESDGNYSILSVDDYTMLAPPYIEIYKKRIKLEKGLSVTITDIPHDVTYELPFEISNGAPIFISITLEADVAYNFRKEGVEREVKLTDGTLAFSRTNNTEGDSLKREGKPQKMIGIMIDPVLLQIMFKQSIPYVKKKYRRMIESSDTFFNESHNLCPTLSSICEPMFRYNYPQHKLELIVKTKTMEILNHIFNEYFFEGESENSCISNSDVPGIVRARKIIIENMASPPTIPQLAKMARVNQFKLKKGFKELFGNTIYGYLREERMKHAKNLLEHGNKNVSETAWDVGYTNVSHFIETFRKHYGVSPGKYLVNNKRKISDNFVSEVK